MLGGNLLAPYYLPLITLPFLVLRPITPEAIRRIVDLLIGATYAFHLVTGIKDANWKQPDLKSMGRVFSTIVILLFQVIWLVIVLSVVSGNYGGILTYFRSSLARGAEEYGVVREVIRARVLPVLADVWDLVRDILDAVLGVSGTDPDGFQPRYLSNRQAESGLQLAEPGRGRSGPTIDGRSSCEPGCS